MATYGDLQPGAYHLIQENSNGSIDLIFVMMITNSAILIEYEDAEKTRLWFRKTDTFHEYLETFSVETATQYEQMNAQRMAANEPNTWLEEEGDDTTGQLWDEEEGDVDYPQKN